MKLSDVRHGSAIIVTDSPVVTEILLLFVTRLLYSTVRTSFLCELLCLHTILMDVQHALNEDYVGSAVMKLVPFYFRLI